MKDDLFTTRLRHTWRQLVELNRHRAERETAIEQEHEVESCAARNDLEQAEQIAEARIDNERRDIESTYHERRETTRRTLETKIAKSRQAYEIELRTIEEKAKTSEQEARKQMEEAIWLSETVYEATEDQPRLRFDQETRTLAGRIDELRRLHESAATWLSRCRQPGLEPWPDEPQPPATLDDPTPPGAPEPAAALEEHIADAASIVDRLLRMKLPRLCVPVRLVLLVMLAVMVAVGVTGSLGGWSLTIWMKTVPAGVLVGGIALAIGLSMVSRARITPMVKRLNGVTGAGVVAHGRAVRGAERRRDAHESKIAADRSSELKKANLKYDPIISEIGRRQQHHIDRIHEKYPALINDLENDLATQLAELDHEYDTRRADAGEREARMRQNAREQAERRTAGAVTAYEQAWSDLQERWRDESTAIQAMFDEVLGARTRLFPGWSDPSWETWEPPTEFVTAIPFGSLHVDMAQIDGGVSTDKRLPMNWPSRFTLPAALGFPDQCSLLIEHGDLGADETVQTLQTVMFRLLTTLPPGKVRFTIIDPVGLGQNFAAFMHLADSLESLVTDRIWTETRHIEQRLVDLTDHMENVIQKYLRNEYETIAEYNEHAGEIAEPYRFLVIANFPVNMSDTAAKRLASIVNSGKRCGVYTLIGMDGRQPLPKGFETGDLRRASVNLLYEDDRFVLNDDDYRTLPLTVETPPDASFMIPRLRLVGEAAKDSSRVEVPFQVVTPDPAAWWTSSSAGDLRVPLGRSGATSLQQMELGHGTAQHVLIAGKTGSGKSTLLHVLITNLALWYSPEEVEMYLVDFKKGVEFKSYANFELPHARAVAIESDREFGLSVLQRLDSELKRRGELFREHGAQDVAGYRRSDGPGPMPRTLLIIDEFQEFFTEDDKIAQEATLLLDRLVRQGRAFGVHVILGSQTLGGAYSLAKSTMGQMGVRIALQCSESDSYMILSEDNAAARLLARPGEAIYNGASGLIEGNNPFQTVWLSELERERYLRQVHTMAAQRGFNPPEPQIVFEGNVAADVTRNKPLTALVQQRRPDGPAIVMPAYLGEAVAIKDPTAAQLRRQAGHNLLIVGQRDEAAVALLSVGAAGLAATATAPNGSMTTDATFHVLDGIPADSPFAGWAERLGSALPHGLNVIGRRELETGLKTLADEVERRQGADLMDEPPLFLLVMGLQRFRDLRQSDSFSFSMDDDSGGGGASPDKLFQSVLRDGPVVGVHTLIWCDTATNVDRSLDRQSMREFDLRIVFQMSASDSTNLIDTPLANKLGLHHALFYSEELGVTEKFRPYGVPDDDWFDWLSKSMGGVGSGA